MDAFRIGVIFDCDGTLIDSMMVWRETEAGLARRANVTLTAAEIDALTAMTIPECGAFFHERFGLGSSGDEVVAMMDELMLEFYRERALARPGSARVRAGVGRARGAHECGVVQPAAVLAGRA